MSKAWFYFLTFSILCGCALRWVYPFDIAYSNDHIYMIERVQAFGVTEGWPALGMPSGVSLRNPGMSIWIFIILAELFGAKDPISLTQVVEGLNCLALVLLMGVARYLIPRKDREHWFWAIALASVNSFAVMYHRVIWTQSILPFFCVILFVFWLKREKIWGAFGLGFLGICLGQIHMSGFFFLAAIVGALLVFELRATRWISLFSGVLIGALGMIPWFLEMARVTGQSASPLKYPLSQLIQFRFWTFWFTNPLSLHHGNVIGTLRGKSAWVQLQDFLPMPYWNGSPTYLVAVLHLLLLVWALIFFSKTLWAWIKSKPDLRHSVWKPGEQTHNFQSIAFLIYGVILTVTAVTIRRYYLIITFPFEWIMTSRMAALAFPKTKHHWLGALFVLNLAMTIAFTLYIRVHGGGLGGEFGKSYRIQLLEKSSSE